MIDTEDGLYSESKDSTFVSYGFKFSLLLHFTFVLWLVAHWVGEAFYPSDVPKFNSKKSIRVDMVDLPSLKFNELNKVDLSKEAAMDSTKETPQEEVVAPPSKNAMQLPGKEKPTAESAKDDKKNRLAEIQKSLRAEGKRQDILAKYKQVVKEDEDKRPALGGNILSKGGSTQGEVADETDAFKATVHNHVGKFWQAPPWSLGQNLSTRVTIKLSPAGRVLSKQITKSSGRAEYDASVIEAVEAADPFPAPPEVFKRLVLQEGIECKFPD